MHKITFSIKKGRKARPLVIITQDVSKKFSFVLIKFSILSTWAKSKLIPQKDY